MADAHVCDQHRQFNQHVLPYIQLILSIDDVAVPMENIFVTLSNFLDLDSISSSNLVNYQHLSVIDIMMYPRILNRYMLLKIHLNI